MIYVLLTVFPSKPPIEIPTNGVPIVFGDTNDAFPGNYLYELALSRITDEARNIITMAKTDSLLEIGELPTDQIVIYNFPITENKFVYVVIGKRYEIDETDDRNDYYLFQLKDSLNNSKKINLIFEKKILNPDNDVYNLENSIIVPFDTRVMETKDVKPNLQLISSNWIWISVYYHKIIFT